MAKGIKTGGRQKGTPNKLTSNLKEAILRAANAAGGGGEEGIENYLVSQAHDNPTAFMSLLGKVLPTQVEGGLGIEISRISRRIVKPE